MCAVAMCVFLAIGRLMMPNMKHHHIILLEGKARGGHVGKRETNRRETDSVITLSEL
jgi:hypothetical protein